MHITSLLNEQNVLLDLDVSSKEDAIERVVKLLSKAPEVIDAVRVRQAILAREEVATTAVGNGYAIPHANTDAVSGIVGALARLKAPVEMDALDDQPVRLLFLLVGQDSRVGAYLKILSRVQTLLESATFRKVLLQAEKVGEVLHAFEAEEERYFETSG